MAHFLVTVDIDKTVEKVANSDGNDVVCEQMSIEEEPCVGMEFASEDAAKKFYDEYARRVGFKMRIDQCRRSEIDKKIISRRLSCRPDGYPKEYSTQQTGSRFASSSPSRATSTTSIHVTALDGLVNVNSLFTIAVFVGLSLTTAGQHSLENRSACDADVSVAKKLLVFEVVSFSFFLFSSLVAQGLKLAINLLNSKDVDEAFRAHINLKALRFGMLGSAVGSVMGCLFLMLSMVNVIEIRLGMLSCGSRSTVNAVASMIVLVTSALLVYISTAVYAFLH
ncbi:hypothetical protein CTI12_AA329120 [Artemisia annua]|uniref:FAR1 domain-containing protein n=1 Tax=Artemisia annua TaxID=35608 RepID=A0A2U1MVZ7_ARTAN|nr:hypothetical protein CTI12_AA329120 [Artemisia annua]